MPKFIFFLLVSCFCLQVPGQTNILTNGDFETYTICPNYPGQIDYCTGWNNVNLNSGMGLWGTPDYFNTCGSSGYAPPSTFAGTCATHGGNGMATVVLYNTAYPGYREYISRQLPTPMQAGTTYTFSFWITNGTGIISPWAVQNIGACFSASALTQSGYGVISATPQCEVTSVVASTVWTQYTFTVNPSTTWNYITFGSFRSDVANTPTMVFPNPGGAPSAYANYFIDDLQILMNNCPNPPSLTLSPSSSTICSIGGSVSLSVAGATSYSWTPSNSLSSSTASLVTANPSVTTVYTVVGTTGTCSAASQVTVYVQPVFMNANASSSNLCSGQSSTLTVSGASNYTWEPGPLTTQTIVINPTANTIYTVTGTNSVGCSGTTLVPINVLPSPTLTATASQTICEGTNVTFTAQGPPSSNIYWLPFSNTVASTSITLTSLNPGITTLTILVVAPNGCTASATRSVLVNPVPSITISPASQTVCLGSNALFSASGAQTYTWYPSAQTGSNLTVNGPASASNHTVIATSAQGCTASAFASLQVNPGPTVTALASPPSGCAGTTISLSANGANSYTWQPGGTTGSLIVVLPLATTIYTVFGEANSCISSQTVAVSNPVDPVIISSGNISCTQSLVTLIANSSSSLNSVVWSGPGVNGLTSPNVVVAGAGTYSVQITNPVGNCSGTATMQVLNTIAALDFTVIPSSTVACFPGPPVNMLISAPANYSWYPASEVSPSIGPLVSVNPTITTTYTVEASQGVCSGSAQITISVNITPTINLLAIQDTICAGRETTLSGQGAVSYVWNPGALTGPTINASPLSTTVYTVTGSNFNCHTVGELTVTVLPSPQLTVSASPLLLCVGNTSTLTASGASQLNWLNGDPNSPGPVAVVMPFGNTTYTAIGTNSSGCSSTATITVYALSSSTLSAQTSSNLICSGESVTLSVTGADSYTWIPSGLTGPQIVQNPTASTTYTVFNNSNGCGSFTTVSVMVNECGNRTFGVTNAASVPSLYRGSFYKINFTITVVNNAANDLVDVKLEDDLRKTFPPPCTYTVVEQVNLKPSGSRLSLSSMFDGDIQKNLTNPPGSTLTANSRDTLLFSVLLDPKGFSGTIYNTAIGTAMRQDGIQVSDSSNNGFLWDPDQDGDPTNNDTLTPIEIPLIDLFIPEGFTPDGDGQNDLFVIRGLNGRPAKLEIYNRWGNKVYMKEEYDNSWDGYLNVNAVHLGNGKLPDGTYYYMLQFSDKQKEIHTGFVVLKY